MVSAISAARLDDIIDPGQPCSDLAVNLREVRMGHAHLRKNVQNPGMGPPSQKLHREGDIDQTEGGGQARDRAERRH